MKVSAVRALVLITVFDAGIVALVWFLSGGSWLACLLVALWAIVSFLYFVWRKSAGE
jgi:hypothetical protein